MCGRPAVPSTRARARETKSSFDVVSMPYFRPGLEERLALAGLLGRGTEQLGEVEPELGEHQHGDQDGAAHQQDRLDDLDPGGALHAADGDVEDHQHADADDRQRLEGLGLHVEEQCHECTCAHHLREQVEDRDDDRRGGRGSAHRALLHPVGQLVRHRVATGVAQQLGNEQEGDQPGHQEADGVEEAVVPVECDQPGDAEERRRGHVVAGDGHAVLEAAEVATAGVEVGGAGALPAGPEGDADGEGHDRQEQHGCECLGAHRSASLPYFSSSWRASGSTWRFM